jgi:hypothetical protein
MYALKHQIKLIQIVLGTPYKPKEEQSERNTQAVMQAVRERFPDWADQAEPYRNVLTFQEWKRRGFKVKRGEKSIRIPIMKEIEEDDGKAKRLVRRTACLFALPQVEKN